MQPSIVGTTLWVTMLTRVTDCTAATCCAMSVPAGAHQCCAKRVASAAGQAPKHVGMVSERVFGCVWSLTRPACACTLQCTFAVGMPCGCGSLAWHVACASAYRLPMVVTPMHDKSSEMIQVFCLQGWVVSNSFTSGVASGNRHSTTAWPGQVGPPGGLQGLCGLVLTCEAHIQRYGDLTWAKGCCWAPGVHLAEQSTAHKWDEC